MGTLKKKFIADNDEVIFGNFLGEDGWGNIGLYLKSGIVTAGKKPVVSMDKVIIANGSGWDGNLRVYNEDLLEDLLLKVKQKII